MLPLPNEDDDEDDEDVKPDVEQLEVELTTGVGGVAVATDENDRVAVETTAGTRFLRLLRSIVEVMIFSQIEGITNGNKMDYCYIVVVYIYMEYMKTMATLD